MRIIIYNFNGTPEYVCAEKRICKDDKDFRTNLTLGNIGEPYNPTNEEIDLAKRATKAIPNMYLAGVDIIKDVNGNYYVLEVNMCPGKKIIDISGVNFEIPILNRLLKEL